MAEQTTAGPLFPKIPGPWKRETEGPNRNKVIEGAWTSRELELLAGVKDWYMTEKLDGTNIRIHWDGYRVSFGGRTDNAQMPPQLQKYLEETFTEELFEQQFGETAATVYGEGIGPKIQSGGAYGDTRVVVFEVLVGGMWLLPDAVTDVAVGLGVERAPMVLRGVDLYSGIEVVRSGLSSRASAVPLTAEGLVATLESGLRDRRGNRIQVKLKTRDLT
jgi:hypothetical protein